MERYKEKIKKHLKDRGIEMHPGFEMELNILANEFKKYWDASDMAEEHGYYNVFDNGTIQRNAYATQMDKCISNIRGMADRFGLSPKAFESMKLKKTTKGKLDDYE